MHITDVTELDFVADVAVIRTAAPPVNALAAPVRAGLLQALTAIEARPDVRAIVIACRGRTFHAGADIGELARGPTPPLLTEVLAAFERTDRLLIAALHGTPLGGGLELALTADYRIAAQGTKCGLPEVKLGLIPGAGGTQRLPRAIGIAAAVEAIATGRQIPSAEAVERGLIDRVVADTALEAAAVDWARELAATGAPKRRLSDRTPGGDAAALEAAVAALPRQTQGLDAPAAAVRALRACLERPFAEGLAVERTEFVRLLASPQSLALRHLFFAERAVTKSRWIDASARPRAIARVGVIGAGTMGGGIAMAFLNVGLSVCLVEQNGTALERGVAVIRSHYAASRDRGKLSDGERTARLARLNPSVDLGALADCDLVIEAIYENMEAKLALFTRLGAHVGAEAILASNTSYLDIERMAQASGRPGQVVGLHFFSPAHVNRLLEIVRTDSVAADTLATAQAVARTVGKVGVVVGNAHGFVGNRMLLPRQREADLLVLEGARPRDVDRVLERFGFAMGPFRMRDLAGMDIGWNRDDSRSRTVREILCEMGRLGQKSGGGYYDYDASRRATPSEEADAVVRQFAAREGIAQRIVSDTEILERCLYPMINEGAKILAEGIAERASDIDTVWVAGYGWPAHTGGPMHWAGTVGWAHVVERLDAYADTVGDALRPDAALRRLAQA